MTITGVVTQIKSYALDNAPVSVEIKDATGTTETLLLWGIDSEVVPFSDWIGRCAMLGLARDALLHNLGVTIIYDDSSASILSLQLSA